MAITKRTRFEVLRRDNHTCRYCGAKAPDVPLTVDHVIPEALGGTDDPTNLVAACRDCNAGKASSSPDAALVADVAADAIRWARALERVATEREAAADQRETFLEYFEQEWIYGGHDWCPELPADWRETAWRFYTLGLRVADLDDAIRIALNKHGITLGARWKYFCGVCWTKVRQIESRAAEILRTEEGCS